MTCFRYPKIETNFALSNETIFSIDFIVILHFVSASRIKHDSISLTSLCFSIVIILKSPLRMLFDVPVEREGSRVLAELSEKWVFLHFSTNIIVKTDSTCMYIHKGIWRAGCFMKTSIITIYTTKPYPIDVRTSRAHQCSYILFHTHIPAHQFLKRSQTIIVKLLHYYQTILDGSLCFAITLLLLSQCSPVSNL